eukprot:g4755.t1
MSSFSIMKKAFLVALGSLFYCVVAVRDFGFLNESNDISSSTAPEIQPKDENEKAAEYAKKLRASVEKLRYKSKHPAVESWTEPLFKKCNLFESEPFYSYNTDSTPSCLAVCIFHKYCEMVTYSVKSLSCDLYHNYELRWQRNGQDYCWKKYGETQTMTGIYQ